MAAELGLLSGFAAFAASRGLDELSAAARVREVMASVDADTLVAMMQCVDEGDFERAGRVLSTAREQAPFKVAISYVPNSADPYELEILEMEQGRYPVRRAQRTLSSWTVRPSLMSCAFSRDLNVGGDSQQF